MKDSNTILKLYNFSILDDNLESVSDQFVCKLYINSPHEFYCAHQAWFDIATDYMKNKDLLSFAYLLHAYSENIYIAKIGGNRNSMPFKIIGIYGEDNSTDDWNTQEYIMNQLRYMIGKLVNIDYNADADEIRDWYDNVSWIYIGTPGVEIYRAVNNMLATAVSHNGYIMSDIIRKQYSHKPEYFEYKKLIYKIVSIKKGES